MDSLVKINENRDLSDERTLQIMQKLIDSRVFVVTLTGGDPFCRKPLLLQLAKMTEGTDTSLSVNTNLLLLDDDILNSELCDFLVSCVSSDPETYKLMTDGGDYHKFEKNLARLVGCKTKGVQINMVVNKRNLQHVRSTATRMAELGVKRFAASPMMIGSSITTETDYILSRDQILQVVEDLEWMKQTLGLSIEIAEALPKCLFPAEILQKDYSFLNRACSQAYGSVQVSNRGFIRPCPDSEEVYGNILEDSLQDTYARMEDLRVCNDLPEECKSCVACFDCRGGCRVQAYNCTKSKTGKDPWMTKPFLDASEYPRMDRQRSKPLHARSLVRFTRHQAKWRKEPGSHAAGSDGYVLYNPATQNHTFVKQHAIEFLTDARQTFARREVLENIASHYRVKADDAAFLKVMQRFVSMGFAKVVEERV